MVNRYEYLINSKELDTLIRIGVVPIHILDWIQIYKYFLDEMKENKHQKMVCYLSVSEHFNLSEMQIRRIVKFMS